ncbi:MAG: hypothetical protein QM757_04405 [Paludibaculum sp.]
MEGPVGAQSLFEVGEGEAGIHGQEGACGVDCFQDDIAAAAAAHAEAEDAEKFTRLGGIAVLDLDDFGVAGEAVEFAGLAKVADDELEVFGGLEGIAAADGLVAVGDDVAGEGEEDVAAGQIGRKGGHAREAANGSGDLDDAGGEGGDGSGLISECKPASTSLAPGGEMAAGGGAIAGEKVELDETPKCVPAGGRGRARDGGEFLVGGAGTGVPPQVEELGVGREGGRIARRGFRCVFESLPGGAALSAQLHLANAIGQVIR